MKKVRIGVIGVGRGENMIRYCATVDNAEIVAICDHWVEGLDMMKKNMTGYDIAYYTDYDAFLKHDMDAVVLANYATEHAPFAIKALKSGKHVLSEVLPVQTMKEAVELVETVEETGLVYAYAENYCFMPAPREMRRLYLEGKLGEFEYGECEYIHNCESINPEITYGDPNHWRNNTYSTFYCTHSLGPILHSTGLRPVSVIGMEGLKTERVRRMGRKTGCFGIEMVMLENGGIIKSIHGGLYMNSVWYSMYGSKGRLESAREDAGQDNIYRLYVNCDEYPGEYANRPAESYLVEMDENADNFGHGGSDFYCMKHFINRLLGDENAEIIDVYEALNMSLPGMFAYRSILKGNIPMEIPDLRKKEVRDLYRNDTACTIASAAGDQLLPTCSLGTPEIEPEVYEAVRQKWLVIKARKEAKALEKEQKALAEQEQNPLRHQ